MRIATLLFVSLALALPAVSLPPHSMIAIGDTHAYVARPAGRSAHAGIVVVHEWWGLNDWIRTQADKLAAAGYLVVAPDLFHGKTAQTAAEAQALVENFDTSDGVQNLEAAARWLRHQPEIHRVGVLGWCFGGGLAARLAEAEGHRLNAAVIYYGDVPTSRAAARRITAPVLGNFGGADRIVTPARVAAFQAAMKAAGHPADIKTYPGMPHAFAGSHPLGPSNAVARRADRRDAWRRTLAFFWQHLR